MPPQFSVWLACSLLLQVEVEAAARAAVTAPSPLLSHRQRAALRCSSEAAYCEATLAYTAPPLLLPVAPPHTGLIDEKRQIYSFKHLFGSGI